jgi:hypothetical protein
MRTGGERYPQRSHALQPDTVDLDAYEEIEGLLEILRAADLIP